MSHDLDMSNGRANMAFRGETPWHGLGHVIEPGDSARTIQKKAGLNFSIEKADVMYQTEGGVLLSGKDLNRSVLYRSDTKAPLSVMSTKGYHVVQPNEIVEFIDSTARAMGWPIETAGSLKGGRKIWALAKLGEDFTLPGGDKVEGYLLAATACDGSMASEFMFTSVRVVCQNTLHAAVEGGMSRDRTAQGPRVKVYHFNKLDVDAVKKQLGIATEVWGSFVERARQLATIRVTPKKAVKILKSVYAPQVEGQPVLSDDDFIKGNMTAKRVLELYDGRAMGSDLTSAKGTAWGLVNAATEFYDHHSKTRSADNRLNSAWFGSAAGVKQEIVDACFEMAA